jgi:hypothetical protein
MSLAIMPCPIYLCLGYQKRNNLMEGKRGCGMRSKKSQGGESEVSFEKMH